MRTMSATSTGHRTRADHVTGGTPAGTPRPRTGPADGPPDRPGDGSTGEAGTGPATGGGAANGSGERPGTDRRCGAGTGGTLRWPTGPGTVGEALADAGVDRRSLLRWATGITAALALPPVLAPDVANAVTRTTRPTLIWLEFQNCTGDTESLLRAQSPSVSDLILKLVSLDYHETLMAPSGARADSSLNAAVKRGRHLLVVEGSVPQGADGAYCVVGGRSAQQILARAAKGAAAVIAVGTCSAYGGLPAAAPNPTGAVGVPQLVSGVPVLSLPGCPANADNIVATLVHYLTFGKLPATDAKGRPLFAYGQKIHDNCPRRGHYEAGEFALRYGDEGHRKGWCLYKLGCKGPWAWHNCPTQQWNGRSNWPVGVGARCIACSERGFWDLFGHASPAPGSGGGTATGGTGTGGGTTASGSPTAGNGGRDRHRDEDEIERTAQQTAGIEDVATKVVAGTAAALAVGATARHLVTSRGTQNRGER